LDETHLVLPNICDDKQGSAKYLRKKLPEMCDDKRDTTLNTAELLPNKCDNHHLLLIVTHIWPSVTNIGSYAGSLILRTDEIRGK
jgi:hypothetical protein